jgi:hypothetical protein
MDGGWVEAFGGEVGVQKGPTRRSISPGYRLWSAILEHDAGVCW